MLSGLPKDAAFSIQVTYTRLNSLKTVQDSPATPACFIELPNTSVVSNTVPVDLGVGENRTLPLGAGLWVRVRRLG